MCEFATNEEYYSNSEKYLYDLGIYYDGTVSQFNNINFNQYDQSLFEKTIMTYEFTTQVICIDGNIDVKSTYCWVSTM